MKRQSSNPASQSMGQQPGPPRPVNISDADLNRAAQRLINNISARLTAVVCNCAEAQTAGKQIWLCLAHGVMKIG